MLQWRPFEIHTHTVHSDGDFTPSTMLRHAKARGFAGAALTDHNTASGLREFHETLQETGLCGIDGIEWTTYFGHMLVLGEQGYTDWRGVQPEQIDAAIEKIHANRGLVGIAHPFSLSNPVNTGYEWRFQVHRWENVDYIEVWSRDFSPEAIRSFRAFAMWENLLKQGYHIGATSGRDWHRPDAKPTSYGTTYLGFDGAMTQETALDAIRRGRMCVTAGPLFSMTGTAADGKTVEIGDTVPSGRLKLNFTVDDTQNVDDWKQFAVEPKELRLVQNGEVVHSQPVEPHMTVELTAEKGYLRAELMGRYRTHENYRVAFTNPIYID